MNQSSPRPALLITGGTGMVGRPLAHFFTEHDFCVYLLARHPETAALEIGERAYPVPSDLETLVLCGLTRKIHEKVPPNPYNAL